MNNDLQILLDLLRWSKPIELPQHHQWKHEDQPALLEWRIRARPYNTTIANGMFAFMTIAMVIVFYLMLHTDNDLSTLGKFAWSLPPCAVFLAALYGTTHQKTKFAYRFTKAGMEVCEWKELSQALLVFVKWFAIFSAIVVVFLIALDPSAFILALAGPGGMGLVYLAMANSKGFKDMHTEYHHRDCKWDKFNRASIYTQRSIIGLHFDYFNTHRQEMDKGILFIYCRKKKLSTAIDFLKNHLSHLEWQEEKIEVY
ncbi:conserved membrane hypothetical protein [Pseudomonas sp. 8AS]|uniref:hypothetical protein n=1 Tax=Pseudomonas sp. 8AS TaxID=2653163 RepID=UPI0012F2597A|nr:hypothetical protein [Pseudomonas sp. 8AS]VXB06007.1 conserved membrane hypothetical protein [Pseudomonas sp. 8AS]